MAMEIESATSHGVRMEREETRLLDVVIGVFLLDTRDPWTLTTHIES